MKNGKLRQSKYLVENYSDLLRVAILSMFGGTYLDNDIILLRTLPDIKKVPNFVGRQDEYLISKYFSQNKNVAPSKSEKILMSYKFFSRWCGNKVST